MNKPEFVYVTYIATTPEKLWQALTDAAFTRQYWMECELISDWKIGSPMTMKRHGEVKNECVIRESEPPRRLAYDWVSVHDPEMKREKPSRVSYLLEPHGDLVKLTVTHENFADGSKTLPSVAFGWPMVLSSLKSFLETGKPLQLSPPLIAETEAEHGRA
jgi:uncharacterized protein YndB with AHSA1/START domain